MKLGEMLVRDGRLSTEQLSTAIEVQGKKGGRLGSILVENQYIDAETLTVYLGIELGIPIATGGTLERCKRSAVQLLTAAQASKFCAIPIVIQGRTLVVAIDNPHDLEALDGISAATGYRVIPKVAPEIRITYYLERYYGIARDSRFSNLGDSPRGSRTERPEHKDLPPPPLPGLPPKNLRPEADGPAIKLEVQKAARRRAKQTQELTDDAAVLIQELDKDVEAEAEPVDEKEKLETQPIPMGIADEEDETDGSDDDFSTPLALDDAIEAIKGAENRAEVACAILRFCRSNFDTAALLLVRDNMAFGWKGYAPDIADDRIETILIPLDPPSIFQKAISNDNYFSGRSFRASLHTYLFRVLRTKRPQSSVVCGICIGDRAVNFLYGQKQNGAMPTTIEKSLKRLTSAASDAYIRMIAAAHTTDE